LRTATTKEQACKMMWKRRKDIVGLHVVELYVGLVLLFWLLGVCWGLL